MKSGTVCSAIVALLLVTSGCRRHAAEAISRADYVKSGNAICARGNEQISAVARQPTPGASEDAFATFVRAFVPGIRQEIRELRALGFPKGDKDALNAIFNDAEAVLSRAEHDPSTIDGHAFDDVNRRLTSYGLRVCGS